MLMIVHLDIHNSKRKIEYAKIIFSKNIF
jgi:hypothetical protein